jgi:hypothetical protein
MPSLGIAFSSEVCGKSLDTLPQGRTPVPGVFPAGVALHLLEIRVQAIQLSPYHAGPPSGRPYAWARPNGFLACCFSHSLSGPGEPSGPGTSTTSIPSPLRGGYSRAPRGAARGASSASPRSPPPPSPSCAAGSPSAAGCPPTRCSSPAAAPRSAATPWNGGSPSTPPPPRSRARPCSRKRYRPTSCAIPRCHEAAQRRHRHLGHRTVDGA